MARTNIFTYDERGGRQLAGSFDPDESRKFDGDYTFNAHANRVCVHTNDDRTSQDLYLTPGGRWVLAKSSQYHGVGTTYRYIDAEAARLWLILNSDDEAVTAFFGDLPSEFVIDEPAAEVASPARGGRRPIGRAVEVRFDEETIAALDSHAAGRSSRADVVRQAVADFLARAAARTAAEGLATATVATYLAGDGTPVEIEVADE